VVAKSLKSYDIREQIFSRTRSWNEVSFISRSCPGKNLGTPTTHGRSPTAWYL